jgi:hypothetical protein
MQYILFLPAIIVYAIANKTVKITSYYLEDNLLFLQLK